MKGHMSEWKLVRKRSHTFKRRGADGKVRYRVRYQEGDVRVQKVFQAPSDSAALRLARQIIAEQTKPKESKKPKAMATWEELVGELTEVYKGKSFKTYESWESTTRVHLIPFLNSRAPYVSDESPSVLWLEYRAQKEHLALANHHKHFKRLCRHAFEKGLLDKPPVLDWVPSRDDQPEAGVVISREQFSRMVECSDATWKDRLIIGWYTGMRPGEIRCLRKAAVDFKNSAIHLRAEDTKTRSARSFKVPEVVMEILRRRKLGSYSEFFFPNAADPKRPMDKSLRGWNRMLRRAGITGITPHDLRHSYLTRALQNPSLPHVTICYAVGMSLEVAQKRYLHLKAEDTAIVADAMGGG